ncbi:MAG TPA: EAL domain-containing protein [Egibacteraceae bacterium]|nr:EAL domain-containing protein [Egibacteraceae bacterium]
MQEGEDLSDPPTPAPADSPGRLGGVLVAVGVLAIPLAIGLVAFSVFERLHSEEHAYRQARLLLGNVESAASAQHALAEHAEVMGAVTEDVSWRLTDLRLEGEDILAQVHTLGIHVTVDDLEQAWSDYQNTVFVRVPGGFDPRTVVTRPTDMDHAADSGGGAYRDPAPQSAGSPPAADDEMWSQQLSDRLVELREAVIAADEHVAMHAHEASGRLSMLSIAALVGEALIVALLLRRFHRARRAAAVTKAERAALADSEARFRSLVHKATDIVTVVDVDGAVTYESSAVEQVLGYSSRDRAGSNAFEYVHPGDRERAQRLFAETVRSPDGYRRAELRLRHADGSWRWMDVQLTNLLTHASVGGVVLNQRDVTERKVLEEELRRQALHDPLTGLPNRVLFRDRIVRELRRRRRDDGGLAVLFVDLDNFKGVNDQLGHDAGDLLLASVARRLTESLRPGDTAARLGGDEFGFLLEHVRSTADAEAAAERILACLKAPFVVGGREVFVGASIGVALSEGAGGVESLLRNADFAMYMAKSRGRRRYEVFDTDLHDRQAERFALEVELRRAVERDEFMVQYQPIADLATGEVLGTEILLRWTHPSRGLLLPGHFIPVAEDVGLIVPMGSWVLAEACRQASAWREALAVAQDLSMSVNVSAKQLAQQALVTEVEEALASSGLPPGALTLEITESAAMQDVDGVIARLNQLRDLGVQIALDDFGVGFSSLSYLRRLPIDVLKIDRSFVDRLDEETESEALIAAVVTLGRTLGLKTVAEGVEREAQLTRLRQMGCDMGQGTFFAPPMDADAVGGFLSASSAVALA